jgi:acyl dehydratase
MTQIVPRGIPIERGKIHVFAEAILDDNPLYHDEQAARAAGLPSVVAPPTFAMVTQHFPDDSVPPAAELQDLDLRFMLHGAQEFVFERPLFAGDLLRGEPGAVRTYEKQGRRGGKMKFIEIETVYRDQNGAVVLRAKTTAIQTEGVVKES